MGIERRRLTIGVVALLGAVLAACSPQGTADSAQATAAAQSTKETHPVSGLRVIPVTVQTAKGPHRFATEVAETSAEQAKGLMFRTELGPDEAMIFPRQGDIASFWMKNTPLPLDIIFIRPDHTIARIADNTVPFSETPVDSGEPVSAVLELRGGRAAELGIDEGDKVNWDAPAQ